MDRGIPRGSRRGAFMRHAPPTDRPSLDRIPAAQYIFVQVFGLWKRPTMSPAKEAMLDIIGRQPDDSSYDEILRELAFARMIQRGLDDAVAGRTRSDEEVAEVIESWRR
jgi:predicted transcriptional regulator